MAAKEPALACSNSSLGGKGSIDGGAVCGKVAETGAVRAFAGGAVIVVFAVFTGGDCRKNIRARNPTPIMMPTRVRVRFGWGMKKIGIR